jgi:hypothetical protein
MAYEDDEYEDDTDVLDAPEQPDVEPPPEPPEPPEAAAAPAAEKWIPYDEPDEPPPPRQYAQASATGTMTDAGPEPPAPKKWLPYEDEDDKTAGDGKKWLPYEESESPLKSFGRELAHGVGPAAAGAVTGAATGAALTSWGGPVAFGGAVVGGIAGGFGASTGQEAMLDAIGQNDSAKRAANARDNPWSTAAGTFLSNAAGGAAGVGKAVVTTGARVLGGIIGGGWETTAQIYEGKTLKEAIPPIVANTAGGATFAGGRPWTRGAERIGGAAGRRFFTSAEINPPPPPAPTQPGVKNQDWTGPPAAVYHHTEMPFQEVFPFSRGQPQPYNPKTGAPQEAQIGGGERQMGLPIPEPVPPPRPGVTEQPQLRLEPPPVVNAEGQYGFNITAPDIAGRTSRSGMPDGAGTSKEATPPSTGGEQPPNAERYAKDPAPPYNEKSRTGNWPAVPEGTRPKEPEPYPHSAVSRGFAADAGGATPQAAAGIHVLQPGQMDVTVRHGLASQTEAPPPPPRTQFEPPRRPEQGPPAPPSGEIIPPNRALVPHQSESTQAVSEPPVPTGHTRMYQGERQPPNAFSTNRAAAEAFGPVKSVDVHNRQGMPFFTPGREPGSFTTRNNIYRTRARPIGEIATQPTGRGGEPPPRAAPAGEPPPVGTRLASPDLEGRLQQQAAAQPPVKAPVAPPAVRTGPREMIWRVKGQKRTVRVSEIQANPGYVRITYKGHDYAVPPNQLHERPPGKGTKPGEPVQEFTRAVDAYGREHKVRYAEQTTLREALNKHGSSHGLLNELTPEIRRTVERMIGDMPVYVVSPAEMKRIGKNKTMGYYSLQQDHIVLHAGHMKTPSKAAATVLHEGIHGVTSHAIRDNPEIRSLIAAIRFDVRSKHKPTWETKNAFKNDQEFVAEAHTEPTFQKVLADHILSPAVAKRLEAYFGTHTPIKTAWDALVQTVRKVLGIPVGQTSALEAIMRATQHAIDQNPAAKAAYMKMAGVKPPANYATDAMAASTPSRLPQHEGHNVERKGLTTGRFPNYRLVVDGVDLGMVKRKTVKGRDRALGRSQPSYDVWAIHGTELPTQAAAEAKLIERAKNFGTLPADDAMPAPSKAKVTTHDGGAFTGDTVHAAAAYAKAAGYKPHQIFNADGSPYTPPKTQPAAPTAAPPGGSAGKPPAGSIPPAGGTPPPSKAPATTLEGARQSILSQVAQKPSWYSKLPTTKAEAKKLWRDGYTAIKNAMDPIEQIKKQNAEGATLTPEQDFAMLARLTKGLGGRFQQIIKHGTYDISTGKVNGKGLDEIIKPINEHPDEFTAYALSKRTIELEGRGIKTGMNLADARRVVAEESHRFEPVFRDLHAFQDRVLENLVKSGMVSQQAATKMRQLNKEYVPFYRALDPTSELGVQLGSGLQTRNPIFKIKGSDKEVHDPIDSIIKNTYVFTDLAHRNQALTAMKEFNNRLPEDRQFMKRDRSTHPIEVKESELQRYLDKHGIEGFADETLTIFRPDAFKPADDKIRLFNNGKAEVYKVDPDVGRAVNAMDKESQQLWLKIVSTPAKWLRAGAVLSPEFMLRNPLRDMLSAFIQAKHGSIPVYDFAVGLKQIFAKSQHYQEWLINGGANANLVSMDRAILHTDPLNMKGVANVLKDPRQWLEPLRKLSELSENATRVGMYKRAREKGVHGIEAAYEAREGTLDFARIGSSSAIRAANAMVPFLNVHLQGLDSAARAFRDNPTGFLAKVGAGITTPSVLLWFRNKDDERVQQLPAWQKDLFWIVKTDDWKPISTAGRDEMLADMSKRIENLDISKLPNTFRKTAAGTWEYNDGILYRVPKPFELGVLFGSIPERLLDSYFKDNPNAFKGLGKTVERALVPNYVPQIALPFMEQWANRSLFLDRNLLTEQQTKLPPAQQFGPHTSETAKELVGPIIRGILGDKSSFGSPIVIDNYIRQWSGGLGAHVTSLIDAAIKTQQDGPAEPSKSPADMPLFKAFVARFPGSGSQAIQDFYDLRAERKMDNAGAKELMKTDPAGAAKRMQELSPYTGEPFAKLLKADRDAVVRITKDKNMSPDDKRAAIDLTYLIMIEHAKKAVEVMEKTKRKAP